MENDDGKKVEKRMSPEYRAAMARYIPISTDPIDKYTPDWFKENMPAPKWPVIHIRKPGPIDIVNVMERQASEGLREGAGPSQETTEESPGVKEKNKRMFLLRMSQEAIRTWRERVEKFENLTDPNGHELKWCADDKGVITDACLNLVPWNLVLDVHMRYDALFDLTPMEKEGLESQPA